jgi:Ca2+-binding EF-hand superfamily protein
MRSQILVGAATVALLVAGAHTSGAQGRGQRGMRFAGMDRNGDGVITRDEWQGSEQSFRTHDWNHDGVLSGDELRPGARPPARQSDDDFDSPDRDYPFTDWTESSFNKLDHNGDNRLTRDEWHFDMESFHRADHNGDGVISRAEFLGTDSPLDDDREDLFSGLDANRDGRVSRDEWHGDPARFNALDVNHDGVLTRAEAMGTSEPPPDLFTSIDVNRDGTITRDEWHWSAASFDRRDANRDGRLSRSEFVGTESATQSAAYKAGYERGLTEGRAAGREDKERNQGWDLEGQRELETADSGYQAQMGSHADYQAGYRAGFRRGYREGWGPR